MKFHGICIVIIVICYIEVCYSECQEYVLFLRTRKCVWGTSIKPIGIKETSCSTFDTFNEISRCKRSVLELECFRTQTSCKNHYNITSNSSHTYIPAKPPIRKILPPEEIPATITEEIPAAPSEVTSAKPTEVTPAKPAENIPARPTEVAPAAPTEFTLARPAESIPAAPTQDTPARPAESIPAAPTQDTPARPAEITPAAPTEDTPAKPAEITPAAPTEDTPALPTEDIPATTTEVTPGAPTEITPVRLVEIHARPAEILPTTPSKTHGNLASHTGVDTDEIVVNDKITYNVEVIYVNEDDINVLPNIKSDKKSNLLECQHAAFVCDDKISGGICSISTKDSNPEKTKRTLSIELKRNDTIKVQPIFTGYANNITPTVAPFEYFKTVTLTCEFVNNYDCEEENVTECNLNIIIKTNYIQNDTRSIYSNCIKNGKTENYDTLELECEGFEEQHILSAPGKEFHNLTDTDVLTWRCQRVDNDNLLHLRNCSKTTHISNLEESDDNIIFITLQKKAEADNRTIVSLDIITDTKTISNSFIGKGNAARSETKCNDYSLLNITEGKIFNFNLNTGNETILPSNKLKINILNWCNNTISTKEVENCTDSVGLSQRQESELVIILKNGTLNNMDLKTINPKLADTLGKNSYYLHCKNLENNITDKDNTSVSELECKWIKLGYNITEETETLDNITPKDTLKKYLNKINNYDADIQKNNTTIHNKPTSRIDIIGNKDTVTENSISSTENKGKATDVENNITINKEDTQENKTNTTKDNNITATNKTITSKVKGDEIDLTVTTVSPKSLDETKLNKETDTRNNVTINKKDGKENKTNITEEPNITITTETINSKVTEDQILPTVSTMNPKSLGEAKLNKIRSRMNKERDTVAAGRNGYFEEEGIEKVLFIVIASVAGTALVIVMTLRKCFRSEEEAPSPTRRAPDEEETPL